MRFTLRRSVLTTYILLCFLVLTYLNISHRLAANDENAPINVSRLSLYNFLSSRPPTPSVSGKISLFPEDSMETDRILEQMRFVPDALADHPINIFMAQGLNGVNPGFKEFQTQNCPVQNCFITADKKMFSNADVVYFRQNVHTKEKLPDRPDKQLWVLQMLENPHYTASLVGAKHQINYTATYRWDSDLVTPYERWTSTDQVPPEQKLPSHSPKLLRKANYAKGKTKKVAMFVSHCYTKNNRLAYARDLASHIQVDIYGTCGTLTCSRHDDRCWKMLDTDYKFYLSFENSDCIDYITEKFFVNGLQHDILPIVMGPTKANYEKVSPAHSFIHVNDFKTAKHLANYLLYLDKNDTAYNEYFQWKGSGRFINTKFWCRLCAMLQQPRPKVYADIDNWWKGGKICSQK